nr:recombinase family protein [Rhizobium sp. 9140]
MHVIGYARVSTDDQNLDLQINALQKAGCSKIFFDKGVSGKVFERPGLANAISSLHPGKMFVVWRLDRLGRSLPKLIDFIDQLGKQNIAFLSLTENIDTKSSGGRLIFHIMGALAEFERTLISERTKAGMEAARMKGTHLGRQPSMSTTDVQQALRAMNAGEDIDSIARQYDISTRTLRRHIMKMNAI